MFGLYEIGKRLRQDQFLCFQCQTAFGVRVVTLLGQVTGNTQRKNQCRTPRQITRPEMVKDGVLPTLSYPGVRSWC